MTLFSAFIQKIGRRLFWGLPVWLSVHQKQLSALNNLFVPHYLKVRYVVDIHQK
jgi:hypothetical protein